MHWFTLYVVRPLSDTKHFYQEVIMMGILITLDIQVGQEGLLIMVVAHMVLMFHLAIKVGRGVPLTMVVAKVVREGLLIMEGPMVTQAEPLTIMARDHIGHRGVVVGVEAPLITEGPMVIQVDRLTIMVRVHIGHLGVVVAVEALLIMEALRVTQVVHLTIMVRVRISHLGVMAEVEALLIVGDLVVHLMEDEVMIIRETDIGIHEMGGQIIDQVPQVMVLNLP